MSEETRAVDNQPETESKTPNKEMSELMKSHLDSITGGANPSHDSWRSVPST